MQARRAWKEQATDHWRWWLCLVAMQGWKLSLGRRQRTLAALALSSRHLTSHALAAWREGVADQQHKAAQAGLVRCAGSCTNCHRMHDVLRGTTVFITAVSAVHASAILLMIVLPSQLDITVAELRLGRST